MLLRTPCSQDVGQPMRIGVFCLACGALYAGVASAQQVINPVVLAPAARFVLPRGEIKVTSQQGGFQNAKQRRSSVAPKRLSEDERSPFDWPWGIDL